MILRNYGIELRSLTINEIEIVRTWRNSEAIRQQMLFQEIILKEDQKAWFNKLNQNNIYLTIHYENEMLGLINVKNIDWNKKSGETGVFIESESFSGSIIPLFAIYCLMDAAFKIFGLLTLKATVKKTNSNALRLNKELGYKTISEDQNAFVMEITKENYLSVKSDKKWLQKLENKEDNAFTEEEKKQFNLYGN